MSNMVLTIQGCYVVAIWCLRLFYGPPCLRYSLTILLVDPQIAVNNTYGIQAVNDSVYQGMLEALNVSAEHTPLSSDAENQTD